MKSRESGQSSVPAGSLKQPLPARDGTFFGIRISITTTYLRRGKRAFFPVFSRENRRIRGDIIPAGCYRNLPGKVRNPDVRRTSETLRFQRSGPIWQRMWISAGGRGRSGDTGTDGRLALPGNRGFLQKNGKYRSKQGCTTRNGRTYAAWRLLNAQRWNPTHRPQFASSSRTGTNGAGSELGQPDSEYTMPRKQKTLRIIDT